jgi:hypothetical protein
VTEAGVGLELRVILGGAGVKPPAAGLPLPPRPSPRPCALNTAERACMTPFERRLLVRHGVAGFHELRQLVVPLRQRTSMFTGPCARFRATR